MSKVSQIFNAVKAGIVSELPTYMQIPDPLIGNETASPILARGFAIMMGPGTPQATKGMTCHYKLIRGIQIQLTRLIENTKNETTAYETTVKAMFEDQFTLLKYFAKNITLGGISIDMDFIGDNGLVEFPTQDSVGRYLDLTTTFQVTYQENLNL